MTHVQCVIDMNIQGLFSSFLVFSPPINVYHELLLLWLLVKIHAPPWFLDVLGRSDETVLMSRVFVSYGLNLQGSII